MTHHLTTPTAAERRLLEQYPGPRPQRAPLDRDVDKSGCGDAIIAAPKGRCAMTRKTTRRRDAGTARQPQPDFQLRWLERYGRMLTDDEIRLIQAHRGLPSSVQAHLNAYASGLIVELASVGRVKAALRALLSSPALPDQRGGQ